MKGQQSLLPRRPVRSFRAAGVTHRPHYPDNLLALRDTLYELHERRTKGEPVEPLKALLIPEPENQFDDTALGIHIPAAVGHVGYVPKDHPLKEHWFHAITNGALRPDAWVEYVAVLPGHEDRPGLEIGYSEPD